ncbi:MAG TPA: MoaD/ThiS family protein [Terriglobales bacterium]|nr:MoaD/ThiS family protein [Terriglobales bacterium]
MKILIPSPLRQYADNQPEVSSSATTVADALASLIRDYPLLRKHLYTDDGKLRAFVNVYLNDDDLRYLEKKDATAVKESDVISIIPSIAGGNWSLYV